MRYPAISTRIEKLAGPNVLTTGSGGVTGNVNGNGNRMEDSVADECVLGAASATNNDTV
jgi:hypothetical protein